MWRNVIVMNFCGIRNVQKICVYKSWSVERWYFHLLRPTSDQIARSRGDDACSIIRPFIQAYLGNPSNRFNSVNLSPDRLGSTTDHRGSLYIESSLFFFFFFFLWQKVAESWAGGETQSWKPTLFSFSPFLSSLPAYFPPLLFHSYFLHYLSHFLVVSK